MLQCLVGKICYVSGFEVVVSGGGCAFVLLKIHKLSRSNFARPPHSGAGVAQFVYVYLDLHYARPKLMQNQGCVFAKTANFLVSDSCLFLCFPGTSCVVNPQDGAETLIQGVHCKQAATRLKQAQSLRSATISLENGYFFDPSTDSKPPAAPLAPPVQIKAACDPVHPYYQLAASFIAKRKGLDKGMVFFRLHRSHS